MTTIYMPMRCYGPPNGHYGWLFEAHGRWYAGSLEMPDQTAPQWLPCKAIFDSYDEALDWFRRGGQVDGPDSVSPSPYCAVDSWMLADAFDPEAGVVAHEAAGTADHFTADNNCFKVAVDVLGAIAGRRDLGLARRKHPWDPKPVGCLGGCVLA